MSVIYLPREEELGFNLDRLPKDPQEYAKAIKTLAFSIIEYSKQIEQLFDVGVEKIVDPTTGETHESEDQ